MLIYSYITIRSKLWGHIRLLFGQKNWAKVSKIKVSLSHGNVSLVHKRFMHYILLGFYYIGLTYRCTLMHAKLFIKTLFYAFEVFSTSFHKESNGLLWSHDNYSILETQKILVCVWCMRFQSVRTLHNVIYTVDGRNLRTLFTLYFVVYSAKSYWN